MGGRPLGHVTPQGQGVPRLFLIGHPRLIDGGGNRIEMTSKKSIAVLGLLALASDGIRSRAWLQQKLWGSRDTKQAQNSLRRELSNMRRTMPCVPLVADNRAVRLDLDAIWIDALHGNGAARAGEEDFLEGLDIAGEDDFEEWLREARSQIAGGNGTGGNGHAGNGRATSRGTDGGDDGDEDWSAEDPEAGPRWHGETGARAGTAAYPDCPPPCVEIVLDEAGAFGGPSGGWFRLVLQELTRCLSRLGTLRVVATTDGGRTASGSATWPDLSGPGASGRHVLQVSFLAFDDTAMLAAACMDPVSRTVIWSETLPLPAASQSGSLSLATGRIANSVEGAVLAAGRGPRGAPGELELDCCLATQRFLMRRIRSCADNSLAEKLQRRLEAARPGPETEIFRALMALRAFWWRPQRGSVRDIRHLGEQAMARNPGDARPLTVLAILEKWTGHFPAAIHLLERAIACNPASSTAHANLGAVHLLRGDSATAQRLLKTADALSPFDPELFWVQGQLAAAAFVQGEIDTALVHAENALSLNSRYCLPALIALDCHLQRGDAVLARRASRHPAFARPAVLSHVLALMPFENPDHVRRLRAAVEKAAARHT